jgi:hypothetical protein
MGTKTIHTLAWKLLVDNDQFLKGTKANKKEIADAKREMRAMLSPAEKMELSLEKLGKLAQKDARFQDLYNRKLAQYNNHLKTATTSAGKFKKVGASLKGAVFNMQSAAALLAGGSVARSISNQVSRYDDLAKSARQAGTDVQFLSQMQYAAGQMIGFTEEQTNRAISQMVRRTAEASMGMGELVTTLKAFGIETDSLKGKSPEQVFQLLAGELRNVNDAQKLNVIGGKLFGEELARMIQVVQGMGGATDRLRQKAVDLNLAYDNFSATKMEQLADSMDNVNQQFNSFSRSFAETVGPGLTQVLMELTTILDNLRGKQKGGSPNVVNRNSTAGDAFGAVTRMVGSNMQAVQQLDPSKLRGFWQVFSVMDQVKSERMNRERESINATLTTAKQSVEQTQLMRTMITQQQNAINNRTFADLN